jgi:hypothetical protein
MFSDTTSDLLLLGAAVLVHDWLLAQLLAGPPAVTAVQDQAGGVGDDRMTLTMIADVLDQLAELGLAHRGQQVARRMAFAR